MGDLKIQSRREGPLGSLTLEGEARLETVEAVRVAAHKLKTDGAHDLIVDAGRLTFVDSASMGTLLEAVKYYEAAGGRFVLYGLSPRLQKMIASMGLSDRFHLAADAAAAKALLG